MVFKIKVKHYFVELISFQVDQIMQHFRLVLKNRRQQVVPCQIMMFASRWSDKLDEFRLRYTWEPIVVISSRVEASVYGGIKQVQIWADNA